MVVVVSSHLIGSGLRVIARASRDWNAHVSSCRTAHDAGGEHHFIPLAWVDHVDCTVHLKQPGAEAKARWKTWSIADFESFSPAGRVL